MTTPADLSMTHPVYTLNLTAAQRNILEWLTQNGALFTALEVDPEQIADDCSTSVSTVYEALTRLTTLRLLQRTIYRVNPRFFFAQNPELAQLAIDALEAPDVLPGTRAGRPHRTSTTDVQRRWRVRPVS
ncbi:transcriptional repressor [Streptomyces anulatus]|uniref:transcriptional repressor n=1 Tax=Streptomyces anulatus TaxID=1892 RepID=UPI00224ED053|nr:transcriptional repressor [Streptomyces anulatus]MCX4489979.1 transcriptional repressor [Streptomyces anulatus]